jgi:hypothetical protein
MFTTNFFQVSPIILVHAVIVLYASSSAASPHLSLKTGKHKSVHRRVLLPDAHQFLGNSHGSVHFWDTKKPSRKVNPDSQIANNKVNWPVKTKQRNNVKRPSSKLPFDFPGNNDSPVLFPDTNYPGRNPDEQNGNVWFDGEGIEQRMLMPRGYSMPQEMFGPNYIWDTKGWPRLIKTTPRPVYSHLEDFPKNKLYNDSPLIFKDNPSWPLHFPTISPPQINKQNNYQNNFIEGKPESSFEADGIEPRISLTKGYKIPKKVSEPVYAWDKKGWPKFVATTPEPPSQHINTSLTSKSKDAFVFFP